MFCLPQSSPVQVEEGGNIEIIRMQSWSNIPSSRSFKLIKYFNPHTGRWAQLFVCSHVGCTRTFTRWQNLFDHLRVHTNEQPYQCTIQGCSKAFTQHSNLKTHLKRHANKAYSKCNICPKSYTSITKLMRHVAANHE